MFRIIHQEFHKNNIDPDQFLVNWPMVYLLEDGRRAYVGQSNRVSYRFREHWKSTDKQAFQMAHLIYCDRFNLSATLSYESQLIQLIAADAKYQIINKNEGIRDKNYYNKEFYDEQFALLWEELRKNKLVRHTIEEIHNSDLFKYSPYKELTVGQQEIAYQIVESFKQTDSKTIVVKGMPGSGKTVLGIYLFKLLREQEVFENRSVGLVIPQTSLRKTLRKLFAQIYGLHAADVIGPSDVVKKHYNILIADEAHRLRQRKNITNYRSHDAINQKLGLGREGDELDWLLASSTHQVLFYDAMQVIGPAGISIQVLQSKMGQKNISYYSLYSQMRVQGGTDYVNYVAQILCGGVEKQQGTEGQQTFGSYEFGLVEHFADFNRLLYKKEKANGLSRMAAGYAWPWSSKKDANGYDLCLEGISKKWNHCTENWVYSEGAIDEVGCIHSLQGYDLNYAFVIIGPDLVYRNGNVTVSRADYFDQKGKNSTTQEELLAYIRNIYYVLMTRGIKGTYLYVCDPKLREYISEYVDYFTENMKNTEEHNE